MTLTFKEQTALFMASSFCVDIFIRFNRPSCPLSSWSFKFSANAPANIPDVSQFCAMKIEEIIPSMFMRQRFQYILFYSTPTNSSKVKLNESKNLEISRFARFPALVKEV